MNQQHSGEVCGTVCYLSDQCLGLLTKLLLTLRSFISDEQTCSHAMCLTVGGKRLQSESCKVVNWNKSQKSFKVNKVLFEIIRIRIK